MTTLRRIIIWILVLAALGLFCWGLALYLDWPLWMALALFLGIVGSYLLVRFLHRLYVVVRVRSTLTLQSAEQKRLARLASPETSLKNAWSNAVATLRSSSLRRFGNPLYVLPWYLIIGQSGTGKTTALTRARLSSSIQRVRQGDSLAQTANYDWWYFDEAIVLDCAGRYVAAEDTEQDRKEWNLGLDLLAKYRAKEGINGLVLAVSADRLMSPEHDRLAEEGQIIRQRIDQLIRLFGKRFPIYILVTKCDLIYGFEGWTTALPRDDLKQALGYLDDPQDSADEAAPVAANHAANFVGQAMAAVGERLRALRIALVARTPSVGPDLLLFPNELAALESGLKAFANASLSAHPYLETPLLRGLFFSSGQQQGGAASLLADQSLPTSPRHATTNSGLFLRDFFGRILPQDRHLSLPALAKNPWIKVTENLGLMAWLLVTVAVGIAITVGFLHDMGTLSLIDERYPFKTVFASQLDKDVAPLRQAMDALVEVERRNQSSFNLLMVDTDDMVALDHRLRERFTSDFRKYILSEVDAYSSTSLATLSTSGPNDEFARSIRNHVRYINLIVARRQGADYDHLAAMPQRQDIRTNLSAATLADLRPLFLADLAWTPSQDPYLTTLLQRQQDLLNDFAYNDPPFAWVAGLDAAQSDVTPSDFWRLAGERKDQKPIDGPRVAAIFTLAGQQEIERFFVEMQSAAGDAQKFQSKRAAFEQWYREQRVKAWQQFVEGFPDMSRQQLGETSWRAELGEMTGNRSPYFLLVESLSREFAAEAESALPGWLRFAKQFTQLRQQATDLAAGAKSKQLISTINAVGGKAIQEAAKGSPKSGEKIFTTHLAAADALKQIIDEINELSANAAQGSAQAYQLAADFHSYGIDSAVKTSALNSAVEHLAALKKLIGNGAADSEAIWRLIGGPLRFATQYIEEQASCAVQADWEAKVLFPLQAQTNMKTLMDELYGQKGSVWAFAGGVAKPFLRRDSNRYQLIQTAGFSLPFTPSFLPSLNTATSKRVERVQIGEQMEREAQQQQLRAQKDDLDSKQKLAELDRVIADNKQKLEASKAQTVKLKITARPTSLNADAKAKPYATILSIACASGARKISNFNFQVSDTVVWAPGQCGDVELQIKVGDLVLSKKYPGSTGLYSFLRDFRDGTRQFYADEFPTMKGKLEQLAIRQIGVEYTFDGADALIAAVQQREALTRIDKEKTAEKQQLQDQIALRAKQAVTAKLEPPAEPPMQVRIPVRIGMCWAADEAQLKQTIGSDETAKPADAATPPAPPAAPPAKPAPPTK